MSSSSRWAGTGIRRPGWKAAAGAVMIVAGVIVAVTPAFGTLSPHPRPSAACASPTAPPSATGSPSPTGTAPGTGHAGAAAEEQCQSARHAPSGSPAKTPAQGSRSRAASSCFFIQPADWIGSAYLGAWANAGKLKGSALLSPGVWNKAQASFLDLHGWRLVSDLCNNTLYQYTTGGLDYGRHHLPQFPPTRATFLSFGFVPTTATTQLTQVPTDCKDVTGHLLARAYECIVAASNQTTNKYIVTGTSYVQIKVWDVRVNGVLLDVGNNCHTKEPVKAVLQAASDNQYDVLNGGILQGSPTISPFTGCGTRENLDAIIDAALSGKGNLTKLTQGPTCAFWINPPIGLNSNCRVAPGRGHPYGVPMFYPTPLR